LLRAAQSEAGEALADSSGTNYSEGPVVLMTDDDESTLISSAKNGDQSAFAKLVERYQRPVFNLALRITGDPDDAMDVTQTSFIKAYDGLSSFDPARPFFSWIYRIGVNESLNWTRKNRRTESLPEHLEVEAPGDDPERALVRKQSERQVLEAIQCLSEEQRAVVVLCHFRGLRYREMAEILEIPVDLVRSRLFSARRRLRQLMTESGEQQ
jgi:RNA polymerase sigma-70 factor (ECF subfamily)